MRPEQLMEAVGRIDDPLIGRAEARAETCAPPKRRRFTRRFAAVAVCAALTAALGVSAAFAAGVFGGRDAYFGGDTEPYMDLILSTAVTAANDEMELRLEGAIADGHNCCLLVSFTGLTEETKARFTGQNNLDEQQLFQLYALTAGGERVDFPAWESASYTQDGGLGRKSLSMLDGADMSYLVTGSFTGGTDMSDVETVCFAYEGLTLELKPGDCLTPEYTLHPETAGDSSLTDLRVSSLGFSFTAPEENGAESGMKLWFICADGSLREAGWWASGTPDGEGNVFVHGHWGGDSAVALGLIDPEDYLGVQVNGENYYFDRD